MKRSLKQHKPLILFLAFAGLLVLVLRLLNGFCMLRTLTGIPCPGCGMTRAVLSALRGDFRAAFAYHPLWVTLPLLAWLVFCSVLPQYRKAAIDKLHAHFPCITQAGYRRAETVLSVLLLCAFLCVYAVRLGMGWRGI